MYNTVLMCFTMHEVMWMEDVQSVVGRIFYTANSWGGAGGEVKALVDASVKNPSFFTCSLIVNCNYTRIKPGDNQTVITNYTHKF